MDERPGQVPRNPSERVIEQRIRNRVIEYLELAASFEEQQRLDAIEYAPYEVINRWEDCFPFDPRTRDLLGVYSRDEVDAIRAFHPVWDAAADAIPDAHPTIAAVQALPEWIRLRDAAALAREVFERRGKLSEDEAAR